MSDMVSKRSYICTLCNEVNPTRQFCCMTAGGEGTHVLIPLHSRKKREDGGV